MKYLLIPIISILLLGFVISTTVEESKQHWESIGPRWDKMLNPCKYEPCNKEE